MFKTKKVEVEYREDGRKETVDVVEVSFRVFYEACAFHLSEAELAQEAVRVAGAHSAICDKPAPRGWIDSLTDDSIIALMHASSEINITAERAKKAGGLISERLKFQTQMTSGEHGGKQSHSSSQTDTSGPSS